MDKVSERGSIRGREGKRERESERKRMGVCGAYMFWS